MPKIHEEICSSGCINTLFHQSTVHCNSCLSFKRLDDDSSRKNIVRKGN